MWVRVPLGVQSSIYSFIFLTFKYFEVRKSIIIYKYGLCRILKETVKNCKNMADFCRALDKKPVGGNYYTLYK